MHRRFGLSYLMYRGHLYNFVYVTLFGIVEKHTRKQRGGTIMNAKQKLGYMFVGCLFTIAGYILASLGGGATHAQQNEQVIDKIVCRELEVVNEKGQKMIRLGHLFKSGLVQILNDEGYPIVMISEDFGSGHVSVHNKEGKTLVDIKDFYPLTGSGGSIELYNKHGQSDVQIISQQGSGGFVSVLQNKDHGKGGVFLSTSSKVIGGGYVAITDNDGNSVVRIYQNREHGKGGVVSVLDENTNKVAEMSVDEMGNGRIQTRKGGWKTH